ncbi:MAG: twin-arginine translocation signal domain-containing protein [Ignavibacteriales bacterium]|nr:twin-arginine translocation signal domain-containing protein [Ignavibacteriales bacterium]
MKNKSRREFIKTSALSAVSLGLLNNIGFSNTNNYNQSGRALGSKGGYFKMAYEWKFNPRPYSDEEAKTLLKDVIDAETTDWHYNTHHKGYVTFLNNIEKEL